MWVAQRRFSTSAAAAVGAPKKKSIPYIPPTRPGTSIVTTPSQIVRGRPVPPPPPSSPAETTTNTKPMWFAGAVIWAGAAWYYQDNIKSWFGYEKPAEEPSTAAVAVPAIVAPAPPAAASNAEVVVAAPAVKEEPAAPVPAKSSWWPF